MIDNAVERQYADCKELLEVWGTFNEYFNLATKGQPLSGDAEDQFLDIKSKIAMLHDSFMEALTHDQSIGQGVLKIIESAITLKHVARMGQAEIRKMEIEWHEAYLLLTETIGALEDRRNELATMNAAQVRAHKAAGAAGQNIRNFFTSGYFKLGSAAAVFLFLTVGVQVLGIFDYNNIGNIGALRAPYIAGKYLVQRFNPDSPWPSVAAMPRKPFELGKKVYEAPVPMGDSSDALLNELPAPLASAVRAGNPVEYVKEELKTKFREGLGQQVAYIHSFRFGDANQARAVKAAWQSYLTSNPETTRNLQFVQNAKTVNIAVFIQSTDADTVNDLHKNIYQEQ